MNSWINRINLIAKIYWTAYQLLFPDRWWLSASAVAYTMIHKPRAGHNLSKVLFSTLNCQKAKSDFIVLESHLPPLASSEADSEVRPRCDRCAFRLFYASHYCTVLISSFISDHWSHLFDWQCGQCCGEIIKFSAQKVSDLAALYHCQKFACFIGCSFESIFNHWCSFYCREFDSNWVEPWYHMVDSRREAFGLQKIYCSRKVLDLLEECVCHRTSFSREVFCC